ncbi:Protein maph-9 [Caenorhabditis elegans]|uniref:Protein maph-9 n=1 Tax=Caenorhabditis elegans TaxID=6239 RepID=MAP9_CAEEL|nr:Protein maph-9 [Caenorhabditis elegans]Q18452.2 RecName: Full=Protein maph-9 [Caenorhabditis elegans]CCD66597.1 Protein maph-9 [Caenorhabditis elegans]|eukprot:NP_501126.1 Protein maph-9 [Caenorhabditis elegans]
MGEYQLHQSRNLSVNQTLDEILGISRKSETTTTSSGSSGAEKNALNSPIRPPTRHGRESSGSNEENKDPIQLENGNGSTLSFLTSSSSATSSTAARRNSDDDFIKKLNDIRRRSLISTMDATSTPTTSVPIHFDSPRRESRPCLEIHVEESPEELSTHAVEITEFHRDLSENSLGTSTDHEDPSLTFRVDKELEQSESKKTTKRPASGVKKTLKASISIDAPKPKPRPRPQTSANLSTKTIKDKDQEMMQMSMFGSKLNKPSDAHHKEWLQKKEREIREKKAKEKAAAEQKAATEKERRENSAKLYQRWVQDHDKKAKELKSKKTQQERKKSENEKTTQDQKLKEAEKNYEMWKRERSKSVTDIRKKLEQEEDKKRKKEEEAKNEKIKEAQAAFLAWKRKKEELLNEEAEKLKKEQVQKQLEESEKMTRLSLANEAYETWIELKESEREFIADFVLIEAPPIPWLPPSNLIPRQFVRSSNGNRLRARSQSAKSIAKRSRSRPGTTTSLRPFR